MSKINKPIIEIKKIVKSPKAAFWFLNCIYYLNEIYLHSSNKYNRKYKELLMIIEKYNKKNNEQDIKNYIRRQKIIIEKNLKFCKSKKSITINSDLDAQEAEKYFRIIHNIKIMKKEDFKSNSWEEIKRIIKKMNIVSIPKTKIFKDKRLCFLSNKYYFKEIKLNLFNTKEYSKFLYNLDKSFNGLLNNINNNFDVKLTGIGYNNLSIYYNVIECNKKANSSFSFISKTILVNKLESFTHEYAHFIDGISYENNKLRNKILKIKNQLKHKNFNINTRFFNVAKKYDLNNQINKIYWQKDEEIFARFFEKTINRIYKSYITHSDYYYNHELYPSNKEIKYISKNYLKD